MADGRRISRRRILGTSIAVAGAAAGAAVIVSNQLLPHGAPQGPSAPRTSPSRQRTRIYQAPTDYARKSAYDWAVYGFNKDYRSEERGNEHGGIAWGTSYLIQSYLTMAEATGDLTYMDHALEEIEAVLNKRDSIQRRADYLGRYSPAWGASSPYTAQEATLLDAAGSPLLQVRSSATRATGVSVECLPGAFAGSFDLHMVDASGANVTFAGLSLDPASGSYAVRTLLTHYGVDSPYTAKDPRPAALRTATLPPAQRRDLLSARYVFAIHTGMIAAPLARFAQLARQSQERVTRYGAWPSRVLEAVTGAVDFHSTEWTQLDSFSGTFAFPRQAPIPGDGTPLPHNQNLAMANAMMRTLDSLDVPAYRQRLSAILRLFRSDWSLSTAPTWPYYLRQSRSYQGYSYTSGISTISPSSPGNKTLEDTSHATIDVAAAAAAATRGLVITQKDAAALAKTFLIRIQTSSAGRPTTRNGLSARAGTGMYDAIAALWAVLAPWNRSVYNDCLALYNSRRPEPTHAYVVDAIATLVTSR